MGIACHVSLTPIFAHKWTGPVPGNESTKIHSCAGKTAQHFFTAECDLRTKKDTNRGIPPPAHLISARKQEFQLESTNVRGGKKKGQSMCSNRYSFLHFYNFMSRKTDRVNKPEKNQTSITELCLYRAFILSWSLFYLLICPHSTYTQQVSLLIEPLIHLFIYLFTWKILIKQLPCLKKNTLLNTVKGHRHN